MNKLTELITKYEGIVSTIKRSKDRYTNGKKKAFTEVLRDLRELHEQTNRTS